MATANLNLLLREGETFRSTLRWTDSKGKAIDITGCVVRIHFRDAPDGTLLLELTVGNGGLIVTPAKGEIKLLLTAAQTAALTFAKASWDLRVEFQNGDVLYPVGGKVLVTRSVTE
jgi:hypothetical protein